jgi:hypothetical protein
VSQQGTQRQRRAVGLLLVIGSAALAWAIHAHPQGLRAPAWVAYAAVLCFGLAGLVLATEGRRQMRRVLLPLLVACLLVPPLWIAFGAGNRQCGMGFAGLFGVAPAWACRGAFGLGAVVLLGFLVLVLRRPD